MSPLVRFVHDPILTCFSLGLCWGRLGDEHGLGGGAGDPGGDSWGGPGDWGRLEGTGGHRGSGGYLGPGLHPGHSGQGNHWGGYGGVGGAQVGPLNHLGEKIMDLV